MKNQYYLCGYGFMENGHPVSTRVSVRCGSEEDASLSCFGIKDATVVAIGGRAWKYLSCKAQSKINDKLVELHLKKFKAILDE